MPRLPTLLREESRALKIEVQVAALRSLVQQDDALKRGAYLRNVRHRLGPEIANLLIRKGLARYREKACGRDGLGTVVVFYWVATPAGRNLVAEYDAEQERLRLEMGKRLVVALRGVLATRCPHMVTVARKRGRPRRV